MPGTREGDVIVKSLKVFQVWTVLRDGEVEPDRTVRPHRAATREEAEAVARRMAAVTAGRVFYVDEAGTWSSLSDWPAT
jgi:hypothetical protein